MVKFIQIIYGYSFMLSLVYFFMKLTSLIIPVSLIIYTLVIFVSLFLFRVRPHSENQNYPFAFDVQLFSQHRN